MSSLLPHNSSDFERNLEQALQVQAAQFDPDIIRTIHDPNECPVEFLPWLAFAENVDAWNDAWPEDVKRSVIANTAVLHRHKGTRGGLIEALAAINVEVQISEWWEQTPQGTPGTFELTLLVGGVLVPEDGILIGEATLTEVRRVIDTSKRHSLHYTFKAGVSAAPTAFSLNCTAQLGILMTLDVIL